MGLTRECFWQLVAALSMATLIAASDAEDSPPGEKEIRRLAHLAFEAAEAAVLCHGPDLYAKTLRGKL
jgi:hypothetical protein